jgi:DNA-binding XRE family transcriptional regulator
VEDGRVSIATPLSTGERIRCLRLERGMTQAVLAHLVGRSPRWLVSVESGQVDPRLSDAARLAAALGVHLADIAARSAVRER